MSRLRLAIVANEVFAPDLGRMGGFGWAVRQVARCFADAPEFGVDPTILLSEALPAGVAPPARVHGVPLRRPRRVPIRDRPDLMLWIDYRPSYRWQFVAFPRTPVVVWVRDPWDQAARAAIAGLTIPGQPGVAPQGLRHGSTRGLRHVAGIARATRRPMGIALTTAELRTKIDDAYGTRHLPVWTLPNPIAMPMGSLRKADRPLVAVLGRLDPVKRPWIVLDLARRLPDVEFVVMGQSHFRGAGSWHSADVPANVRLVGHADDPEKTEVLGRAWVLLNTSIHDGLAVSMLEALAHRTPLVATVDPAGIVTRFGAFAGEHPGDGLGGLPALEAAMTGLLGDATRRARLGASGRHWVEATHSRERFVNAFVEIASDLGRPTAGVMAT